VACRPRILRAGSASAEPGPNIAEHIAATCEADGVFVRTWRPQISDALARARRAGIDTSVTWLGFSALTCLVALIACDLLLIVADILQRNGLLNDPRFSVTRERGYGEMFQYAKFAAAGCVLAWRFIRIRSAAAAVLAVLFFSLLADDAFGLHEWAGEVLAARYGLQPFGPLRPAHAGEALYMLSLGAVAALSLGLVLWRGRKEERRMVLTIGAGLGMLAVPGIGVDLLHSAVRAGSLDASLAVLEDGGEMIAASSLAAAAVLFAPTSQLSPVRRVDLEGTRSTSAVEHV
jgi:hypothetical protein